MKPTNQLTDKQKAQQILKNFLKPRNLALLILLSSTFFYSIFNIYDVIIDYKLPILLAAFFGLMGVFLTRNKKDYFFAFLGYGSLIIGIPLFINNTFAEKNSIQVKLQINEKHGSAGRHGPSVDVNYEGINKEINVSDDEEMGKASYITLKLNKGLLGYYVITDKKLLIN